MNCQQASERLPWLLNGTLEGQEGEEVRRHVAECAACRAELEETRRVAAAFGAHLPAAVLVDLAWNRPRAGLDTGHVERHLQGCSPCAEELDFVRESRRLESEGAPVRQGAAPAWWRVPALAAGLAAAFVSGLWSGRAPGGSSSGADDSQARTLTARVTELEGETRRLREATAAQDTQLGSLRAPQLNLPVFELLPEGFTRRSGQPQGNEIVIPKGAALVALLLDAEAPAAREAAIEIRNAKGEVVWSGGGLRPSPLGGYTLAVPAALLPEGRYTLTIRPEGGKPTTYGARVQRSG